MSPEYQIGLPSEVGAYVDLVRTTPKGETVTVGMLPTNEAFRSHQAASYRRSTILAKFGKSAGKKTVEIVRVADAIEDDEGTVPGYYLVIAGRAKASA